MLLCAVINCVNSRGDSSSENVSFHRFPTDEPTCQRWLIKCGRVVGSNTTQLCVCSIHFSDDDYIPDGTRSVQTHLKKGSVPNKNLFSIKQETVDDENDVEVVTRLSTSHRTYSALDSSQLSGVDIFCDDVHVENNVNDALVKEEFPASSSIHIPSALPPVSDWPGDSNFIVSFGQQEKTTKGVNWTFSKSKNKLYVGKDVPCPINFSADKIMNDVFIRATVLYSSPEHTTEVVQRCPTHIKEDSAIGIFEAEHFVRCESNMSYYDVDPVTKQHSVKVPFENPPAGQEFSTYIFKFLCFGSCVGGPNRRSLMIIFTLEESGGRKIGRRKLELKVCACPGRDRKTEEESLRKNTSLPSKSSKRKEPESERITNLASAFGLEKKRKAAVRNEKGLFTITTRDEGCHQFLREMKKMYSLNMAVNNLPPDARRTLMNLARDQRASDQEE